MNASHRGFPDTSWTLLRSASDSGNAAEALNEFARRYYAAVNAFIRVIVRDDDLAQDLTQEFFEEKVLRSRRILVQASSQKGCFRPFLKQTIRNFLVDKHRADARTPKADVRPDGMNGKWDDVMVDHAGGADDALLRDWGQSIVQMAIARVEGMCESKGQQSHFAMFVKRYLSEPDRPPSFSDVGRPFGLDEKTARGRVETVVRQFRAVLDELLATDVGSDGDADQEIRKLIALL